MQKRTFTFPHGVGYGYYASIINYNIHDNGGNPYRVEVDEDKKTLKIFMKPYDSKTENELPEKFLTKYNLEVRPGIDLEHPQWAGNTILFLNRQKEYIWISNHGIYQIEFPKDEQILALFSEVGNNDVPYAYAVGKQNIYYLSGVCLPANRGH